MLRLLCSADVFSSPGHSGLCWKTWAALILHKAAEASTSVLFSSRETHLPRRSGNQEGLKSRGVQVTRTIMNFVQKGVSHAKGICVVIPATLSTFGILTDKGHFPFYYHPLHTWQSPSCAQHMRNLFASVSSRIHGIAKFYWYLCSSSPAICQKVLISLGL